MNTAGGRAGVSRPAAALLMATSLSLLPTASSGADPRDRWQRPREVMDTLGVRAGSVVADVGSGDGYFAFHLARRVGPKGRVLAVDIAEDPVRALREAALRRRLGQIQPVLGAADEPRLPAAALDAILVVNAYHEMTAHDAMMSAFARALKPGGRLGIIDKRAAPGESRSAYAARHVLPAEIVREDAERHGLAFVREARGFVRPRRGGEDWYFLVFTRPLPPASP